MSENFGDRYSIFIKIIFSNFKGDSYTRFPEYLIFFYFFWISIPFLPNRFQLPWNIIHVWISIDGRILIKCERIVTRVYDDSVRSSEYWFKANTFVTNFFFILSFRAISNATYAINIIGVKGSSIVHK